MLTTRFEDALVFATRLHAKQVRKGSKVPYVAHLLGVTALVLEAGGDEDQAIAALLHDAVEDQGGRPTLEAIRSRYGERVAALVDGCTDAYQIPKPPWKKRKLEYLEHLQHVGVEIRLVSLADKVHNGRAILADLRRYGSKAWDKFNGGKEGSLWYYRSLLEVFRGTGQDVLTDDLQRIVNEMARLSGSVVAGEVSNDE